MKVLKEIQGKVGEILNDINNPDFSPEEKGAAIRHVLDLATHNGITKKQLVEWCDWLWNIVFELRAGQ